MNSIVTTPLAEISSRTNGRVVLGALVLIGLWFVLCRQLSGEWSVNEQYSYGWFVPFFALFLFWLRWEGRPGRESRKEEVESRKWIASAIGLAALLLLFPHTACRSASTSAILPLRSAKQTESIR